MVDLQLGGAFHLTLPLNIERLSLIGGFDCDLTPDCDIFSPVSKAASSLRSSFDWPNLGLMGSAFQFNGQAKGATSNFIGLTYSDSQKMTAFTKSTFSVCDETAWPDAQSATLM